MQTPFTSAGRRFEELAVPLLQPLFNFAQWLTKNREDAEDLVQDAYVRGHRGFQTFQPGTDFRAWMFSIVRNAFLSSRTTARARLTVALEETDEYDLPTTSDTPETLSFAAMEQEDIYRALENLPLPYREVILLSDVEDFKYREIADLLTVPIGTVMSRLARGRKLLRTALQRSQAA
jgi:RNA polymerase sigma-70 factor (ECF subfamily)